MNRLTLLTICLLAGTTDFVLSQDEPRTNALDDLEMAAPDSPSVSKAKTPVALAPVKDFHLFDGEWKLHSATYQQRFSTGIKKGHIENGVCTIESDRFDYRVVKSDQRRAVLTGRENDSGQHRIFMIVERLEHVLFLTEAYLDSEPSDLGSADWESARYGMVMEFWRVDPQRKKVVQQLEDSLFDVNRHRITGTPDQLRDARQKVQQVTLQLEQLDAAPKLQSLTYQVVAARKEGKHEEAKLLEQQVAALSLPAASMFTPKTNSTDKTAPQDVSDRNTDMRVELNELTRNLGAQHPKVLEKKQRLNFLQHLKNENKSPDATSPQQIAASRLQLEKDRLRLLAEYDVAQQETQKAASDLRKTFAQDPIAPDEVLRLQKQLRKVVTAAFEVQQKLQTVRLSIAEIDLQGLRLKQDRRRSLASQVIERRMQQLLQDDEETDQPLKIAATPAMRAVEVPVAMNALAPYTRIDKLDVATAEVITDELSPISYAEVVGKYLNQRLKPRQRITRDMLVEDPTTEQIVAAALNAAKSGEEVLRRRRPGFPSLTFPQLSHQVVGLPYRYDPLRFYSELPDWTEAYITAVIDHLRQKPTAAWSEEEFHLLWSMELLVTLDTDDSPYDLRPLAQLIKDGLTSGLSDEDSKSKRSPRWHSALTYGIAARLDGTHTELLFKQPVPADNKQTELLKKMFANKAESKWIKQEQVRLAGMLQERPLQTLTLLLQGEWPAENKIATNWLYTLSTAELYESYRNPTILSFTSPVDTLLLVLTMNHLAGESVEIDEHIAVFFTQPSPDYAFLAHLDDLLSSKLSYRDTALEALTQIYQKTSNQRLKAAIKKVAPGACILGVRL